MLQNTSFFLCVCAAYVCIVCVCVRICGSQITCMCEEVSSSIILGFNSFKDRSLIKPGTQQVI